MFFPGSRYSSVAQYSLTLPGGAVVQLVKTPTPGLPVVLGFYRRQAGDRLDQIAARFLADATDFWRVCDSNNAMSPDALAARDLVGIPIYAKVSG
jgi:hypothetical protein